MGAVKGMRRLGTLGEGTFRIPQIMAPDQ